MNTPPAQTTAKRRYVVASPAQKNEAVSFLFARQQMNGKVTKADYAIEADRLGVSSSTVEKWFLTARKKGTLPDANAAERFEIKEEWYPVIAAAPTEADAYYELLLSFDQPVHITTWYRALDRLEAGLRDGLREGVEGLVNHQLYCTHESAAVNELWAMDLTELPVRTCDEDGNWTSPWLIALTDRGSRACIAYHLFDHSPTGAEVASFITGAVLGRTVDGVFLGGVPARIRCDQESKNISEDVRSVLRQLRIKLQPTNSYCKWENGVQERFFRTAQEEGLGAMLGRTDAPTDATGATLHRDDGRDPVMTHSAVAARLGNWIDRHYNAERGHDGIDGKVPLDVYAEAVDQVRLHPDELLASLVPAQERTRQKYGVQIENRFWIHENLADVEYGEPVKVHTWIGVHDRVALFRSDGRFLGLATEQGDATSAATKTKVRQRRAKKRRTLDEALRKAEQLKAIRAGGETVQPNGPKPRGATDAADPAPTTSPSASEPDAAMPTEFTAFLDADAERHARRDTA
jgi:transposase InsO family protein